MRPQPLAIFGRQRDELVLDGDDENPVVRDGRRGMHRCPDALPPGDLAGVGVERDDLGIAGRYIEPIVPKARTAAKGIAALFLGFEIDGPEPLAAGRVERRDLNPAIHREDATLGDDRLRHHSRVACRAVADAGVPYPLHLVRQREVAHRVIGVAARLRPFRIDRRRRQGDRRVGELGVGLDLAIEPEHRDALARQRLLLVVEDATARHRQRGQQRRDEMTAVHWREPRGQEARAAAISVARARTPSGAARSSASFL